MNSIRRALFDHANIVFLNENANSTRISSVSCIISIPSDYYLLFRICSREKKSSATFSSITTRLDVL